MGAVGVLARVAIRGQWRAILVVTLLVGFAGTVVLASAAGARRTSTALDRFNQFSRSADIELNATGATSPQVRRLRATKNVTAVAELFQMTLVPEGGEFLPIAAAVDARFGEIVDRARVISGRLPRHSATHEIAIGEALADRLGRGVDVGDVLTFDSYTPEQISTRFREGDLPRGPRVRLRVVGIVRRPLDLGVRGAAGGVIVPTPAFLARYRDEIGSFGGTVLRVRTRHGSADVPEVLRATRRIFDGSERVAAEALAIDNEGASDAIDVLTAALWVFAGIAAGAAIVAVVIVVTRQIEAAARDQGVLDALGLTRGERALAAGSVALPMAAGGALLAVIGAVLASSLFPFGVARRAEPNLGIDLDGTVVGLGFLTVLLVVLVVGAIGGFHVARRSAGASVGRTARESMVARGATQAGLAPAATTGLRLALEPGRGPTAAPVRSAIGGGVLGVAGIIAVLVFAASLTQLVDSPRLYGWTWDAFVLPGAEAHARDTGICGDLDTPLTQDRSFSAVAGLCQGLVEVDGRPTTGWSLTALRGEIKPAIVAGRTPRRPDEAALGGSTLRAVDKRIGDTVTVSSAGREGRYRIVGQAALPSPVAFDPTPLADAVVLTGRGFSRLVTRDVTNEDIALVARFAPSFSQDSVARDRAGLLRFEGGLGITSRVPPEIDRLRQLDPLPVLLAAFLALLSTAAIGHGLITSVRRRRGDLAVLRTLGFERRQVRATIAWQATTLAVVSVVVGVPLGIALGRVVWTSVADGLGVKSVPTLSVVAVLLVAIAALTIANAIGLVAAKAAVRIQPAQVLRTE